MPPFRYDPYADPMAGSIGDLIARSAEPQARAAENIAAVRARAAEVSGNAYGNVWRSIGEIPQRLEAMKDARLDRSLKQQEVQARTAALGDAAETRADAKRQRIVSVVGRLAAGAKTPQEFAAGLDDLAGLGSVPADVAAHIKQTATVGDWEPVRQRYIDFADQYAKPIDLAKGAKAVSPISGKTIAENPADPPAPTQASLAATANDPLKTPEQRAAAKAALDALQAPTVAARDETARHNAELERIAGLTAGRAEATLKETERHNRAIEGIATTKASKDAGDVTELTPQGLDAAALNYAKTGMLPPLGMGDKNTRKAIINRAAEMMPGLDIASAKADYDANKGALAQLQKQRDAIGAFEQTALKNIDIFLETAGKIVDTGSPLANGLARQISGKLLGSADQAKYDAARQVAINEIAKITSNPNLSGQLSDSARHEVDAFNPRDATLKQTVAVARLLKRDMQNRTSAMDDQIAGIKTRIAKGQATTSTDASDPYEEYLKRTGATGAH